MGISSRRRTGQRMRAVPGAGLNVPIWILGSSLYGAQLAAELGLPVRLRLALRARATGRRASISTARGSSRPTSSTSRM